jgi:photosynthetic reaction center H subunit
MSPVISGSIDVALITLNAFVLFFIGLVIYLNRESRREGFPLEDDLSGRLHSPALIHDASPKTFKLPFGRGTRSTADYAREAIDLPVARENFPGAPLRPTGNPLTDGIGPAAWANRSKTPDLDIEGHPRIVPLSSTGALWLDRRDPDPRGMTVIGADGGVAGTVTDVWVDKADRLIRYLETAVNGVAGQHVLVPMTMSKINGRTKQVVCDALTAPQFAGAPLAPTGGTITFYEEERAQAYFGGGYLYATADRQEPWL